MDDREPHDETHSARRLRWALEAYVRSSRALIHFRTLQDLVENVCHAIVEDDHYALAAVGLAPEAGSAAPVAFLAAAGAARGYAEGLTLSANSDTVAGSGPTGRAMRSGEPVIMRDSLTDPAFAPWRERAERYGIRSSVTVPFKLHGVVRGVLLVYAQRPDAFGPREMTLFRELADELAFAIAVDEDRARLASADAARRAMEAELRTRRAEAEAATEAKSEFLANMSHEIRTPLTAILGFAGLLADSPELPETLRGHAERIRRAATSLHGIVDTILDFSALQAGNDPPAPRPFNPADLIAGTAAMAVGQAGARGLRLQVEDLSGLPSALVSDGGHLRRVLLNLIDNAIRFTEAGSVTVAACYLADKATLRIEVADTGPGIPPALSARLFQSFSQLDGSHTRRHGGAGLGLATARRLIENLGGDIGFRDREGGGSVFWFEAPAPVEEPAPAPAAPATAPSAAGGDVLVVDDAPMNREFLAAILNTLDCRCQFAEDGAEAVAMAELAPFDLILMDMQMPVMDGPTAASRIRTGEGPNRDTPILAVSANVLPEHVAQCLAAGMDDHVPKPIGVADFLGKVGRWLGQRHAAPPDAGARQAS